MFEYEKFLCPMLSYFPLSVYTQFGTCISPCILSIVVIGCELDLEYLRSHVKYH